MPYAHREDIYDADTHMMERPDWIYEFADKDIRDRLEPIVEGDEDTLKELMTPLRNLMKDNRHPKY